MAEETQTSCLHIYCGDGKGKTSAAIGLAVRAAGRGKQVLIARFLKTEDSGEVEVLRQIPGIRVLPLTRSFGFYRQMSDAQRQEAAVYYQELFHTAWSEAEAGRADILILDEILAAVRYQLVDEEELAERIRRRPDGLELVLTGRNPSEKLLELADYISEIRAVRHPYSRGLAMREGIEY